MADFADDAVLEDPLLPEPCRGKEAIFETFEFCHAWANLAPELKLTFASGLRATAEFVVKGTVISPLEGYPHGVVGAPFEFGEVDVFEFDPEGRIVRMSIYADVLGFDRQLREHAEKAGTTDEGASMSERAVACVRRNIDAFNRHDREAVVDTYTGDCELVDLALGLTEHGPEFLRGYADSLYSAFPDANVAVERLISEGNVVAVGMRFTGTHSGAFMGKAPSGNRIDWPSASFFELEDKSGRISREIYYYDLASLERQLGSE